MRALILAGTAEQASALARMLQLDRGQWDYLHSAERMLGHRGTPILLWGSWQSRPEVQDILEMAKTRAMPVLDMRRAQ